ncbi:DUF2586 domain-containing protein [Hymenobacter sp. 15J16-1T3B]|uniref:DUF2586 family protein n=1 Tax=Hymenobacter sp. 15J16-1T3B TaxID=2886941 RepID=UPI001D0FD6DD|nr:DUF2586 family protein [Hymenobacter sp. 15J16-1T3B]MCC3159518.1 DUF2586 domain-containing protein [Hymenobacter sp. 15J16-1T3B]
MGVTIIKGRGGLGRQKPTDDGISGLVTQGVTVADGLQLNTSYEIRSLRQLEMLGVDAQYDAENSADLHYHVREFFRRNPAGVLWLRVVARTVTLAQMADNTLLHAKQLLVDAGGAVKQLALCLDSAADYVGTTTNGLDTDVVAAIPKAAALVVDEFRLHRPVFVLLGGHGLATNYGGLLDLRNLAAGEAEGVSVVIGADHTPGVGRPLVPAVGTLLGDISAAAVHEDIGWLDKFNLASDGYFLNAGLCNGKTLAELAEGDFTGLDSKGFIYPTKETGFDGFYWNDSHTCAGLDSDYAYIENVRTHNKAARVIRRALLPALKGPLLLTGAGQLRPQVASELEAKGTTALQSNLGRADEISACDVFVDPDQDVLSTSLVEVKFSIVPVGVAREIRGTVGFVKSLS